MSYHKVFYYYSLVVTNVGLAAVIIHGMNS